MGGKEARIGFRMRDQRFQIIWGNTLGKCGYQYQDQNPQWNNQMGCPSPRGRQSPQRGRGGNLGKIPQGGQVPE